MSGQKTENKNKVFTGYILYRYDINIQFGERLEAQEARFPSWQYEGEKAGFFYFHG